MRVSRLAVVLLTLASLVELAPAKAGTLQITPNTPIITATFGANASALARHSVATIRLPVNGQAVLLS